jgi:hypothetical protein
VCVLAGLLFSREWIPILGLGFKGDWGKTIWVEEKEIDEAFAGGLKAVAQGGEVGGL